MANFDFGNFLRSLPGNGTGNAQDSASHEAAAALEADITQAGSQKSAAQVPSVVGQGLPPSRPKDTVASGPMPETSSSRRMSVEQQLAARAHSGAANALAAAAAAGPQSEKPTDAFSGSRIFGDKEVVYDIGERLPGDNHTQLEVSPITIVGSDPFYEIQQRVAVNDMYICYSLKGGQIRALHKSTGRRALLKNSLAPPDIRFASDNLSRLASADVHGNVYIWDIELEEERADKKLTETLLAQFAFTDESGGDSLPADNATRPPFAWHPNQDAAAILAMAANKNVFIAAISEATEYGSQITCTADSAQLPKHVVLVDSPGAVSSLAFTATGDKLAAVSSGNQVVVWDLPNNGIALSDYGPQGVSNRFEPYMGDVCSTAQWLSSTVLVTGNADNSVIKLWHVTDSAVCIQSVQFSSSLETDAFFNHMVVQPEASLVILANAKQTAVYTLHFSGSGHQLQFDHLAEFSVSQPILSFTAQYRPTDDPSILQLYCVQAKAIQIYSLKTALCSPSESATQVCEGGSVSSVPQQPLAELNTVTQPPPPPPPAQTVPQHSVGADRGLSDTSSPLQRPQAGSQQQSHDHQMNNFMLAWDELASQVGEEHQSEKAFNTPSSPLAIRTVPTPSAQAEQPKLLTPTHLMQQAKRSASQSSMASLPSQHTPTSATRILLDNSDAVSTASTQGSKLQEGSVSRQQSAETIPASAAALEASSAVHYDSPKASLSGSRANTPPPTTPALPSAAYLTPEHYTTAQQPSSAETEQATRSTIAPSLDPVSAPPEANTVKLLKKDDDAAAGPSQPPEASAAPSAVFSQPLDLLPIHNAAPQSIEPSILDAPEQSQGPMPGTPIDSYHSGQTGGSRSELSEASVRRIADAVAERTLGQHKRVLSYLNEGHREMLRIIKGDVGKEGKKLQLAFDAQVNRIMKSQGGLMAEDRRALLAEQQASMERLVSLISASINRDLPLRMEEIVRAEVSSVSSDFQQQVGSAVQAAISESLPQELAGPQLRAALEASLHSQLQHSLARPLQDSFTAAFQHHLMPAFEGACRDMFAQVQATFAGGLSEHLQAAGGANASVTASLRESLGTAAQLVDDLKTDIHEGQNKLIHLASQKSSQKGSGFMNLADLEAQQDPLHDLLTLVKSQRYEEAFHKALTMEDVAMVAWLCGQVDPGSLLSQTPPVLSQQILLPLIQQLGHDLLKDTLTKLKWIQSTALALDPKDPLLAPHMKPILDQLYGNLQRVSTESSNREAANQARICLHLINSLIHSCST